MTINLTAVTNNQTFGTWLQRTNDIVTIIGSNVVTTDASLGGSITTGKGFVNGTFGSNTVYATYISGGNISSNGLLTILTNTSVNATMSVGNSTMNVQSGWLAGDLAMLEAFGNQNNFVQVILTNSNTGTSSSGDFVVADNLGISSANYIDMGINGTNWSNTLWTINGPSDGYLYTGNTNLSIGTLGAKYINFFANGTLANNEVMRITSGANVGIGNTNPNAKLQVTGTANVSGNVYLGNILTVTGNTTISGIANIAGNTYVSGIANVIGNATFSSNLTVIGQLSAPTISGNTYINGIVNVSTNATVSSVNISSNTTFGNNVTVIGNLNVSGNVVYTGSSAGNVVPVNSSYWLGNSSQSWSLYALTVQVSNTITIANTSTMLSNSYSFASTSNSTIDTFSATSFRSAEYTIQASNSSAYQVSKVLVVHDGTTAYATEYAIVNSAAQMLSLGATKSGSDVLLWSVPVDATVVVKFTRTNLVV